MVAVVQDDGEVQEATDFYCWQHKEQAEQRVVEEQQKKSSGRMGGRGKRRSTELFPLQERSSIDTLVQRLGIAAAVPEEEPVLKAKRKERVPKPPRRTETLDFASQRPQVQQAPPYAEKYDFAQPAGQRARARKPGFWASLCCMGGDGGGGDKDYVEVVRHRKRAEQSRPSEITQTQAASAPAPPRIPPNNPPAPARRPATAPAPPARKPVVTADYNIPRTRPPATATPTQHRTAFSTSQTGQLLSLIPQHLSPQTTSALLAELSKPISAADEAGYIYIFWLTPQDREGPGEGTARSLLSAPSAPTASSASGRPRGGERRISDLMTEYSFDGDESELEAGKAKAKKKTIMLKIGRANNVTRRMNEWQRQCGYALNLVRWYPYVPSSSSAAPSPQRSGPSSSLYPDLSRPSTARRDSGVVRKVPCVKRVERLVHLELQGQQVKRRCAACGKEHREWFEVEASQMGVRRVDECVRRWVGWAERRAADLLE